MYTSAVLLALSGYLAQAATMTELAKWKTDYGLAARLGQKESKPLAVFIGSGPLGWEKLSKEGNLGKEAKDLLSASYVCLYVDISQKNGKQLASAFNMANGPGLVISDRTGEVQAFRQAGEMSRSDLQYYLRRFADKNLLVRSTETASSGETNSRAPQYSGYVPATYAPVMSGGFGGGRNC